jgi:thiamine-monophosphate kinase
VTTGISQTVADLGELELIRRIRSRLDPPPPGETWSGDDTAVLPPFDRRVLLTTDVMVEGIDFDTAYSAGSDVGWKAMAANASDVASMGGRPTHAVAAVSLPPTTPLSFVDDLVDGFIQAANKWGFSIVGGDVSAASEISVCVAMVGVPTGSQAVQRRGARLGDAICVTGALGGAAAGLVALRRGITTDDDRVARLIQRQLRPAARVEEAVLVTELGPTAMIDVSDGLAVDLEHLLEASGRSCDIEENAVPVDPDIAAVDGIDPFEAAVIGGEDFELLFTIDAGSLDQAAAALRSIGTSVARIGTVVSEGRHIGPRSLSEWRELGWEHLRNR